ncbi:MAG: hypothetical protein KTR31_31130 [Myxococcales bacterium]|nr:hypothetical protein [Myxococcales bacterium]
MHILLATTFVVLGIAWLWWRNANTMWSIDVEHGRITEMSGRPPVAFVQVVREVVAFPPVARARVVARRAEQGAVLSVTGLDAGRRQRLQNAFRLQPQAGLRSGPNPVNEENARRVFDLARWLRMFRRW